MKPETVALSTLAGLCDEAARLHGDDWAKVRAHIRERVSALPRGTRVEIEAALERLVGYEPPPPGTPQVH